jgi:hypothetical protein
MHTIAGSYGNRIMPPAYSQVEARGHTLALQHLNELFTIFLVCLSVATICFAGERIIVMEYFRLKFRT